MISKYFSSKRYRFTSCIHPLLPESDVSNLQMQFPVLVAFDNVVGNHDYTFRFAVLSCFILSRSVNKMVLVSIF